MNKKLKSLIALFIVVGIIGAIAWKYINKPTTDFVGEKPEFIFSFNEIMERTATDTNSLNKLIDQLIAINGNVKAITKDAQSTTIELGDSTSMSSIICQIDNRHQKDFATTQIGQAVSIKGKITGFNIDMELGLGNTMQMNYCSLNR